MFLLLLLLPILAFGQISPGELSKYHRKLEGLDNCTQCHVLGKEVANTKCISCHTLIESRQTEGKGFHASALVKTERCAKCHLEHFGLDFAVVHWKEGIEKFDHAATGWELQGAHKKQECRACHIPKFLADETVRADKNTNVESSFLGLSSQCLSCHADEHGEQMTNECLNCHTQEAWTPAAKFSHDNSKYRLTGKHVTTECVKCHKPVAASDFAENKLIEKNRPSERFVYNGLQFSSCVNRHKDAHEGKLGTNCAGCHNTDAFKVEGVAKDFDHNKTGFPLLGKHVSVTCTKCHTGEKMTEPLAHALCSDCHKDRHAGQFANRTDGGKCESCHSIDGFTPARFGIAEHAQTKYPLTGSHLAVPCIFCHTEQSKKNNVAVLKYDFAGTTCKNCHADAHKGQLDKFVSQSGCEFCHSTESWHRVTFNHDSTRFPLVGKHISTQCMKCHTKENAGTEHETVRMAPLPLVCEQCHQDIHRKQFVRAELAETETACKRCHSPEGWKVLTFDHNRDARFSLEGAHANVACLKCHIQTEDSEGKSYVVYRPLGIACADCHSELPKQE